MYISQKETIRGNDFFSSLLICYLIKHIELVKVVENFSKKQSFSNALICSYEEVSCTSDNQTNKNVSMNSYPVSLIILI